MHIDGAVCACTPTRTGVTAMCMTAQVLDAALVVAEMSTGTLIERVVRYFTPEGARSWEPLRCFRVDEERERRARAERAEEVLLTGLTDAVKRK